MSGAHVSSIASADLPVDQTEETSTSKNESFPAEPRHPSTTSRGSVHRENGLDENGNQDLRQSNAELISNAQAPVQDTDPETSTQPHRDSEDSSLIRVAPLHRISTEFVRSQRTSLSMQRLSPSSQVLVNVMEKPEKFFAPTDPYGFRKFSAEDTDSNRLIIIWTLHYTDQFARQTYRHVLLRLPSLYFTRVSEVLALAKIRETDVEILEGQGMSYALQDFQRLWSEFINSLIKEWKTLNVVSALLLSAIISLLQIDAVANQGITRTAAFLSLVSALLSLIFGCLYIIRFGTMKDRHKAARFIEVVAKTRSAIWWNVLVLLAVPAVWLSWSLVFFCVSILSLLWTSGASNSNPAPPSPATELVLRIVVSTFLALGLFYMTLVMDAFRSYQGEELPTRDDLYPNIPPYYSSYMSPLLPPVRLPTEPYYSYDVGPAGHRYTSVNDLVTPVPLSPVLLNPLTQSEDDHNSGSPTTELRSPAEHAASPAASRQDGVDNWTSRQELQLQPRARVRFHSDFSTLPPQRSSETAISNTEDNTPAEPQPSQEGILSLIQETHAAIISQQQEMLRYMQNMNARLELEANARQSDNRNVRARVESLHEEVESIDVQDLRLRVAELQHLSRRPTLDTGLGWDGPMVDTDPQRTAARQQRRQSGHSTRPAQATTILQDRGRSLVQTPSSTASLHSRPPHIRQPSNLVPAAASIPQAPVVQSIIGRTGLPTGVQTTRGRSVLAGTSGGRNVNATASQAATSESQV